MGINRMLKLSILFVVLVTVSSGLLVGDKAFAEKQIVPIDKDNYSGLYKTGVDHSDNKLGASQDDPHWTFVGASNYSGSDTCQNSSIYGHPAQTVIERGDHATRNTVDGVELFDDFGGLSVGIGSEIDHSNDPVNGGFKTDKTFVWSRQSSVARWISQDDYGLHYSSEACKDPSAAYYVATGNSGAVYANTFTFKLKDGFNVKKEKGDNKIDLSSLGLTMKVQSDNLIKVSVGPKNSGKRTPLVPTNRLGNIGSSTCSEFSTFLTTSDYGKDFTCPEFQDNSTSEITFANTDNSIIEDNNDLYVEIYSTYSDVGFLIEDIKLSGNKEIDMPSYNAGNCFPTYYDVSVGSDEVGPLPVTVRAATGGFSRSYGSTGSYHDAIYPPSVYRKDGDPTMTLIYNVTHSTTSLTQYSSSGTNEDGSTWTSTWYDLPWYRTNTWTSDDYTSSHTCYNYLLNASIDTHHEKIIEANTSLSVTGEIKNLKAAVEAYPKTWSRNTTWKLVQLTYAPDKKNMIPEDVYTAGTFQSGDLASYFGANKSETAKNMSDADIVGSADKIFNNTIAVSGPQVFIGDEPVGTQICYTLVLEPGMGAGEASKYTDVKYHSTLKCHTVYKKPKVQIWGGDLFVGRSFVGSSAVSGSKVSTSTSVRASKTSPSITFGSWSEYGIAASGSINGTASGAAFANGDGNNGNYCAYLSFANQGRYNCISDSGIGNYSNTSSMPNIDSNFPVTSSTKDTGSSIDLGSFTSNNANGVYTHTGSLSVTGGNVSADHWIVINTPNADVTISGDINYAQGPFSRIDSIPQVVIYARNINIQSNVKNVDAWLVTKGNLNTCYNQSGASSESCNNKLTVNGPVMANRLYLKRTYGAGTEAEGTSDNSAEVFNLRSDAYLWAYSRAKANGSIRTVYSVDLPPRF